MMPSHGLLTSGRFDSPQEEAAHYREKYRRILDMLDETRAELGALGISIINGRNTRARLTPSDEFQASSKELEDELERELLATEKQQTELKEKIKRLEAEKDEWKVSTPSGHRLAHLLGVDIDRTNISLCRRCTARQRRLCRSVSP